LNRQDAKTAKKEEGKRERISSKKVIFNYIDMIF
jgi:hypothetical protein